MKPQTSSTQILVWIRRVLPNLGKRGEKRPRASVIEVKEGHGCHLWLEQRSNIVCSRLCSTAACLRPRPPRRAVGSIVINLFVLQHHRYLISGLQGLGHQPPEELEGP